MIPNVASDYVSIEWDGYFSALYSENYTFSVEANDGIRVYINNQIVIDYLVDSTSDTDIHILSSTPIALTAG